MENQHENNPYYPVNGELKENIYTEVPQHSQYVYTESWMNQNSTVKPGLNPYNATGAGPCVSESGTLSARTKGLGISIAGMVCGILSVTTCIFMIFNFILVIPGLVFSIISLTNKYDGKGMAIAGVICSACGAVLSIFFMIFCLNLT